MFAEETQAAVLLPYIRRKGHERYASCTPGLLSPHHSPHNSNLGCDIPSFSLLSQGMQAIKADSRSRSEEEVTMSIFSQISEAIGNQGGTQTGSDHTGLVKAALDMFGHPGGMSSLGQGFEGAGLGNVFQSWVGTGANQQVSPQQVQSAVGSDRIQQLAERAGIPASVAPQLLATVLPIIVDKLTPHGRVPQASEFPKAS
jgi:uncharacterized protein YidB (DUF937 family)